MQYSEVREGRGKIKFFNCHIFTLLGAGGRNGGRLRWFSICDLFSQRSFFRVILVALSIFVEVVDVGDLAQVGEMFSAGLQLRLHQAAKFSVGFAFVFFF